MKLLLNKTWIQTFSCNQKLLLAVFFFFVPEALPQQMDLDF